MNLTDGGQSLSALLVGSSPGARAKLAQVLKLLGYGLIWQAANPNQALRYCATMPFDLAIVDFDPGLGFGSVFLSILREQSGAVGRIVLLCDQHDSVGRKESAGLADAIVDKPLSAECLARHLSHRTAPQHTFRRMRHESEWLEVE